MLVKIHNGSSRDGSTPLGTPGEGTATPWEPISTEDRRPTSVPLFPELETQKLWDDAWIRDKELARAWQAVRQGDRKFPPQLKLQVSIAECSIDPRGLLLFRE